LVYRYEKKVLNIVNNSTNININKTNNHLSPEFTNRLSPEFTNNLSPEFTNHLSPEFTNHLSPEFTNYLSPEFTDNKKTTIYEARNPGPGLGQGEKCGRAKPAKGVTTYHHDNWISIVYTYIRKTQYNSMVNECLELTIGICEERPESYNDLTNEAPNLGLVYANNT
jgi:hypothetical protein